MTYPMSCSSPTHPSSHLFCLLYNAIAFLWCKQVSVRLVYQMAVFVRKQTWIISICDGNFIAEVVAKEMLFGLAVGRNMQFRYSKLPIEWRSWASMCERGGHFERVHFMMNQSSNSNQCKWFDQDHRWKSALWQRGWGTSLGELLMNKLEQVSTYRKHLWAMESELRKWNPPSFLSKKHQGVGISIYICM